MHRTNNPFGSFAWAPPGANGKRIEIPDYADENSWWRDPRWTKHLIAHELAHAWDFRNARWNDWGGGPLSARFMTAVGANRDGCATLVLCWG